MESVWRARLWLGIFFTSIFVALSYEVINPFNTFLTSHLPQWLLVVGAFILSNFLAEIVVRLLIGWKFGRALIMSKSWAEGYWYIQTFLDKQFVHPISNDGITHVTYEGDSLEPVIRTYRKKTADMSAGFASVSEFVGIREHDNQMINYFTFPESTQPSSGVSLGRFFSENNSVFPNKFQGRVVLFSDGVSRYQTARRIKSRIVRKLEALHGEDWRDIVLERGYDYISSLSK